MVMTITLLIIIPAFILSLTHRTRSSEFQCSSQISMDPELQSKPQYVGENPPPYSFNVLKENGDKTKRYREDIYTIRLNSNAGSYFRSFLLQARLATKHGHIIGGYRAGEFLLNANSLGIKFLPCSSLFNDSLTNSDDEKKSFIEARWFVRRNEGPIQFLITVIQEPDLYWISWSPKSGLLFPDKDANFNDKNAAVPLEPQPTVNETKIATEQPLIINKNELGDKFGDQASKGVDNGKNGPARFIVSSDVSGNQPNVSKTKISEVAGTDEKAGSFNVDVETTTEQPVTIRRVHSKRPPKISSESAQPAHIADEHLIETLANITEMPEINLCDSDPCFHNGTCESFMEEGLRRFSCNCASAWIGEQCEEPNHCFKNKCKNDAACVLGDDDYSCQCRDGFGGKLCEFECPSYLCSNGGSCVIDPNGIYTCACKPGWTGEKCEKELNACSSNPCLNGGNCTNLKTEFECQCKPGYYGDTCHRACQDVYKSCEFWKQEDKCDSMRPTTSFFDINCPVSCEQCIYDNSTVKTKNPLPFLLEPFAFLLGTWYSNYSSPLRYPLDFQQAPDGYTEELSFIVPDVNMFGTPYLNYSSKAYNKAYRDEAQVNVGFITLKPVSDPVKVAIMSTGNDGLTMIEEGEIKKNRLILTTKYLTYFPSIEKVPLKLGRKFYFDGTYLEERIQRVRWDNVLEKFSRFYTKHVVTPFY